MKDFLNRPRSRRCLLCDGDAAAGVSPAQAPLCGGCWADLPRTAAAVCPHCALPEPGGGTCGSCLKRTPAFDRCRAAWRFAYPLDSVIHAFKYGRERWLGRPLAALLGAGLPDSVAIDAIIPMPLDPARLDERGFNQARLLAAPLARRYGLPLLTRGVLRRAGPHQAGLPFGQRRRNVRGVFVVTEAPPPRLAIVDDVVTSAASVEELAATLRRAGAGYIEVWTLTRTYPHTDR